MLWCEVEDRAEEAVIGVALGQVLIIVAAGVGRTRAPGDGIHMEAQYTATEEAARFLTTMTANNATAVREG